MSHEGYRNYNFENNISQEDFFEKISQYQSTKQKNSAVNNYIQHCEHDEIEEMVCARGRTRVSDEERKSGRLRVVKVKENWGSIPKPATDIDFGDEFKVHLQPKDEKYLMKYCTPVKSERVGEMSTPIKSDETNSLESCEEGLSTSQSEKDNGCINYEGIYTVTILKQDPSESGKDNESSPNEEKYTPSKEETKSSILPQDILNDFLEVDRSLLANTNDYLPFFDEQSHHMEKKNMLIEKDDEHRSIFREEHDESRDDCFEDGEETKLNEAEVDSSLEDDEQQESSLGKEGNENSSSMETEDDQSSTDGEDNISGIHDSDDLLAVENRLKSAVEELLSPVPEAKSSAEQIFSDTKELKTKTLLNGTEICSPRGMFDLSLLHDNILPELLEKDIIPQIFDSTLLPDVVCQEPVSELDETANDSGDSPLKTKNSKAFKGSRKSMTLARSLKLGSQPHSAFELSESEQESELDKCEVESGLCEESEPESNLSGLESEVLERRLVSKLSKSQLKPVSFDERTESQDSNDEMTGELAFLLNADMSNPGNESLVSKDKEIPLPFEMDKKVENSKTSGSFENESQFIPMDNKNGQVLSDPDIKDVERENRSPVLFDNVVRSLLFGDENDAIFSKEGAKLVGDQDRTKENSMMSIQSEIEELLLSEKKNRSVKSKNIEHSVQNDKYESLKWQDKVKKILIENEKSVKCEEKEESSFEEESLKSVQEKVSGSSNPVEEELSSGPEDIITPDLSEDERMSSESDVETVIKVTEKKIKLEDEEVPCDLSETQNYVQDIVLSQKILQGFESRLLSMELHLGMYKNEPFPHSLRKRLMNLDFHILCFEAHGHIKHKPPKESSTSSDGDQSGFSKRYFTNSPEHRPPQMYTLKELREKRAVVQCHRRSLMLWISSDDELQQIPYIPPAAIDDLIENRPVCELEEALTSDVPFENISANGPIPLVCYELLKWLEGRIIAMEKLHPKVFEKKNIVPPYPSDKRRLEESESSPLRYTKYHKP